MYASPFSGTNAICLGNQSEALGDYSLALGQYVKASGNNSIAIGKGFSNTQFLVNNTANSIALGMGSTVPTLFIKTATGSATATGTVGIGTTLIGSKLQVNGNIAIGYSSSTAAPANGLLINGNTGIGTTAATTTEKLTVNGKVKTNALVLPDGEINSVAAINLWNRNGNDIFRLNGKVGIGTTSPTSVFTLSGVSPDILLSNNTEVENESHDFRIVSSNGAGRLICSGDMAVFLDAQNTHDIESIQIFANCDFYGTPAQCPNIKQLFVVTNGGSSINTNLNINGNMMLYDDGRIWAKEIKVALNNPWSDFVFDKDYNLRSLSEVEAFVNTHKHLPDVPSAAEVEKNGIDLAEMNKILLQKIEELTLYLFEQNKKIENISQQNVILNSKLTEIENK